MEITSGRKGLGLAALLAVTLGLTACGPTNESSSTSEPVTASPSASASSYETKTPKTPVSTAPAPKASAAPTKASTAPTKASQPPKTSAAPKASGDSALAALEKLPVSSDLLGGYSRDSFAGWEDQDGNGCNAREDTLSRYMPDAQTSDGCKVTSGTLVDPYTGETINYVAGNGGGVDIDHVVALSAGWKTGMGNASSSVRDQFSNDPLNLLPTDAGLNRSKSDQDASTWLPSNGGGSVAHDCSYVARQIAVKAKYSLFVTPEEKGAMSAALAECPQEKVPSDGTVAAPIKSTPIKTTPAKNPAPAKTAPASQQAIKAPASGGTDPKFSSCKAAKAKGYGPYVKGKDSEYGFYRDGDKDGTVCE